MLVTVNYHSVGGVFFKVSEPGFQSKLLIVVCRVHNTFCRVSVNGAQKCDCDRTIILDQPNEMTLEFKPLTLIIIKVLELL